MLTKYGIVSSRAKARQLIRDECVLLKDKVLTKPGLLVEDSSVFSKSLTIKDHHTQSFVSRAGLKLQGALQHLNLHPKDFKCLDVGISTGGFSDCLLQAGAARVVGIDVGHSQLSAKLKDVNNLVLFEGINARNPPVEKLLEANGNQPYDLIVIDVSFISLTYIIPPILQLLKPQGQLLGLIKPQFEIGPEALNSRGIVKDPSLLGEVQSKIKVLCEKQGLEVLDIFKSCIEGSDGNQEFFIFCHSRA